MNYSLQSVLFVELCNRYAEICLHGTVQSVKFLFLGESGRDTGYLKLSTKFMAPVNVLGKNVSYNCLSTS